MPVQVDERDNVNPGQIYNWPVAKYAKLPGGASYEPLVYTPPATASAGYTSAPVYTPPDSVPTLDADDEVSFLANDTGKQATAGRGDPAGVVASTRQQVRASDPLDAEGIGYLYLYRSTTLTGGSAGTTGVELHVQPRLRRLQGDLRDGPRRPGAEQQAGSEP